MDSYQKRKDLRKKLRTVCYGIAILSIEGSWIAWTDIPNAWIFSFLCILGVVILYFVVRPFDQHLQELNEYIWDALENN